MDFRFWRKKKSEEQGTPSEKEVKVEYIKEIISLRNQLGEKDYEDLATKLTVAPIDDNRYAEETVTFQKALYPIRVEETAKKVLDEEQEKANNYSPGLDYSRFISYVISEGINHSEITEQLKDQIYAIHDIYGNSESELANLVFLAMDKANGNVNLTDLQKIAQRQNAKANSTWQTEAQQDDIYEIRSEANRTSQMYTKEDIEMRKKQLKKSLTLREQKVKGNSWSTT